MKNLWTMLVLVGLLALVAGIPAAAQTTTGPNIEVKFTAPMAFYVGDKLMPAGAYEITQSAGVQANTLLVKGKGKNEAYIGYSVQKVEEPLAKMEVNFNKYGNNEYLNAIKWPGELNTGASWLIVIAPSAGEQAAAKTAAAAAHAIPASKK